MFLFIFAHGVTVPFPISCLIQTPHSICLAFLVHFLLFSSMAAPVPPTSSAPTANPPISAAGPPTSAAAPARSTQRDGGNTSLGTFGVRIHPSSSRSPPCSCSAGQVWFSTDAQGAFSHAATTPLSSPLCEWPHLLGRRHHGRRQCRAGNTP